MKATLSILLAVLFVAISHAASDTDVTILAATSVEIRDDQVTIIGRATTRSRVVVSDEPGDFLGRSTRWIEAYSENVALVINRPSLHWNGPDGEEKAKYRRITEDGWQMTLDAAKDLRAGKQVGRIGYYQPTITIANSTIVKIEGTGYLYPKRVVEEAERAGAGRPVVEPESADKLRLEAEGRSR